MQARARHIPDPLARFLPGPSSGNISPEIGLDQTRRLSSSLYHQLSVLSKYKHQHGIGNWGTHLSMHHSPVSPRYILPCQEPQSRTAGIPHCPRPRPPPHLSLAAPGLHLTIQGLRAVPQHSRNAGHPASRVHTKVTCLPTCHSAGTHRGVE